MTYPDIAERLRGAAAWCFPLLGFAIPVSTAFDSVVFGAIVLLWLAALPHAFPEWRRTLAIRPLAVGCTLFALLAAGTFWSDAPPKEAWNIATKYADLFLVSVLLWAAAATMRGKRAIAFFLAAIVGSLVISYSVALDFVLHYPGLNADSWYPVGFKKSVTHNLFVSFGAYVSLLLAREAKTTAVRAPLIGFALLCAHNVLVIVIGRTGYVVLALLLAYFILASLSTWKSRAGAFVLVACLYGAAYATSGWLQERVASAVSDVEQFKPGAADKTSVGQRLEYWRTSARIIAAHPLAGVGTGGFSRAYRDASESELVTANPHNDYLMLGVQVGVAGIALILAFYALLWHDARRLPTRFERDLVRGIVITMAVGGLFNSLVLDHAEGLLLAWVVALGYAGTLPGRAA